MSDFDLPGLVTTMLPTDNLSRAWYDLNDSGNARRFKTHYGDCYLYVRGLGWHVFTGSHWSRDGADARALLSARATAEAIKQEADALFEAAKRKPEKSEVLNKRAMAVKEWAETSGSINRAKGLLAFAAAELECDLDQFDREPMALNVQNGTVRFHKDTLGHWQARLDPHEASDRISRVCNFAWKPGAPRVRWEEHLTKTMPDIWERKFLMRLLGYVATGLTHEQVFFLWQGRGGDGKSVTAGAVRRVLGSYAATADVKTFLEDKTGRSAAAASPDLARLAGATRFVSVSEPPRGSRLNEGLIKQFTGGAPLAARHLNKDMFEFAPRFRLILECNARPGIGGGDDGIWRRVIIVPWRVQLKREEMDPDAEAKLVAEGEGVLDAIVEGAIRYLERGLTPPKTIETAHADYRKSSNALRDWLESFTTFDPEHVCLVDSLFLSYRNEIEGQGLEPISKKAFGLALSDLQVLNTSREGGTGKHRRKGLRILTEVERAARAAAEGIATDEACFTNDDDIKESGVAVSHISADDPDNWRYRGD